MSIFDISTIFELDETDIVVRKKIKKVKISHTIPWVDKYRPIDIKSIVSQDHIIKILENSVETGELPHLLFYGPPGTGKTSTILAIARKMFGPNKFNERVIQLNASDERGISIVRDKIKDYAKTTITKKDPNYICPPFKIIILDEADSMTPKAQFALRKIIENYAHNTRFCFICNYINRIISPIVSRCKGLRFNPIEPDSMYKKLYDIAKKENVDIDKESLEKLIDISKGDMRQAIMLLWNLNYSLKYKGKITPKIVCDTAAIIPDEIMNDLWNFCLIDLETKDTKKIITMAKKIRSYGFPINNLLKQIVEMVIIEKKISDDKKAKICMHLASTHKILNDGANEYIQLLNTLTFIKAIVIGADSEPIDAL